MTLRGRGGEGFGMFFVLYPRAARTEFSVPYLFIYTFLDTGISQVINPVTSKIDKNW